MAKSSAYKKYLAKLNKIAINVQAYNEKKEVVKGPEPSKKVTPKNVKSVIDDIMKDVDIINITELPETIFEEE
jgi:hypothetical protein